MATVSSSVALVLPLLYASIIRISLQQARHIFISTCVHPHIQTHTATHGNHSIPTGNSS